MIRDAYEKAIAQVPPITEKYYWRRYIYLWIYYALFEELTAGDMDKTRDVYATCIRLIPHKKFTFAKIWLLAAKFEIRQKNLTAARKTLVRFRFSCLTLRTNNSFFSKLFIDFFLKQLF